MKSPLADAERDRLIAAMLPDVPFDGWSQHALRVAAERIGVPVAEARALFPRGAIDIVAAFSRWADRQMLDRVEAAPPEPLSLSRRIARALRVRFELLLPFREAVRRGMTVLAMPRMRRLGCGCYTRRSTASGTRSATIRPISASTQSARASPRSMAPRCCSGSTTARRAASRPTPLSSAASPICTG